MVRAYTRASACLRLSRHHPLKDYWTSGGERLLREDQLARLVAQLEDMLGAPFRILYGYAAPSQCRRDGKLPAHGRGLAVDLQVPRGVPLPLVLLLLETMLEGRGGLGWHRAGRRSYIHLDLCGKPTRWIRKGKRGPRRPTDSFAPPQE